MIDVFVDVLKYGKYRLFACQSCVFEQRAAGVSA